MGEALLSRMQSVLTLVVGVANASAGGEALRGGATYRGEQYGLQLSEQEYVDLGQPREITVTIEPGDKLNNGEEQ